MGYSAKQAKEFIERIAPIIQREAFARGYEICSTTIAQAIIEGAAGTSLLAKKYHNHFGMKCGKYWKGKSVNLKTKEEYSGNLVTISDNFRVYDSDEECVEGYYTFISSKRYANLRDAKTYRQFAEFLKADGYATSSRYTNTLCSTVERYNLTRYDEASIHRDYFPQYTGSSNSIVMALESLGIDSSADYRKQIYNVNFEGSYTKSAKQNLSMLLLLKQGILIKP